jgi:hypothetical protein
MESHYTGAAPPAGSQRHTVHRVTTSQTQQFVIYSRAIFGQWIHWYGNRSHQCTKDKSACNGCTRGWPVKWLGYFDGYNIHADERVFVEITAAAYKLLDRQIPPGENCRGVQVRICKTKGGPKGRYKIEVLDRRVDDATLPQEKDPLDTLLFLWKCKNQHVQSE